MMTLKKILITILALAVLLISGYFLKQKKKLSGADIASAFEDPPSSSRPGVFWCWLNGNISRQAITRDLEEMKAKGISRAEIWDVAAIHNPGLIPAGGAFLGDESVSLIKHALSEGKRLDMEIGIIASSGWNAGGSWVEPHWASKGLYFSELQAEGPGKISIRLPFPGLPEHCPLKEDGTPVFYTDVAILAVPYNKEKKLDNTGQVIQLTGQFTKGILNWTVPEGRWNIIRCVCSNTGQSLIVPSPNSKGLFIDFMDPKATKRHLQHFLDRLGINKKNAAGSGLGYFEFDSMELDEGVAWTDSMPSIFKKRQGYEILPYLPVLAGWKLNKGQVRFIYDFKKTVSDQLIFSHYQTGSDFLKQYHIDLVAEAGGPGPPIWNTCPVDALKALGNTTIPRGEFWIRHRNMFLIKEVSSAAHIYGKKIVDAESFTTWRRWKDSPYEMKKYVDRAYCEGLNNVTFHTFSSTGPEDGLPGRTYHAGSDINPGTTWWEKSRPFMDYLSRCNFLLRQGLFVADVCYYYGDHAPNFFPSYHSVPEKPGIEGLGKGYDFDVVNTDVVLNRMSVKKGRITLPDGMSYGVMVLPDQELMPFPVLEKISELVRDGAVVIGPKPINVPGAANYIADSIKLNRLSAKMWGNIEKKETVENQYGKGKVIDGIPVEEYLKREKIEQDFACNSTLGIDYIHRATKTSDIYFIRNGSEKWAKAEARFRVSGKYPELWDPATGKQTSIDNYKTEGNQTVCRVELPPHGSAFIVFTNKKRELQVWKDNNKMEEQVIEGAWKVNFTKGWGAPRDTVFDRLQSWTDFDHPGIKYYSGTATYHKRFLLESDAVEKPCYIDLGELHDLAEVYVNGKSAGVLWKKPYMADISSLVHPGENDLKVEVVNMWINRLTGDMLSDPGNRYCRTNQPYMTEEVWPGGDETFHIQPAGLLGPVKLLYLK